MSQPPSSMRVRRQKGLIATAKEPRTGSGVRHQFEQPLCFVETILVRQGKGSKNHYVPMHPALAGILRQYLDERRKAGKRCAEVFTSIRQDEGLSVDGLRQVVASLQKAPTPRFDDYRLVTSGVLGLRCVGKERRLATARKHLTAWMRIHKPTVVVVEKTYRHPVPWLNQLHQISRSARNLATRQHAAFAMYSPQSSPGHRRWEREGQKPEVAIAVAHRYPSLRVYLTTGPEVEGAPLAEHVRRDRLGTPSPGGAPALRQSVLRLILAPPPCRAPPTRTWSARDRRRADSREGI
jgi:hypothetical protein